MTVLMFQVSASVVGAPYMHLRSLAFSGLGLVHIALYPM